MFDHKHVIRISAEATGNDGSRSEAIFREFEATALSPGHIFVPFIRTASSAPFWGREASSLLETLKKTEAPLVNEKVERVLSDPAALKEAIQNLLQQARTRQRNCRRSPVKKLRRSFEADLGSGVESCQCDIKKLCLKLVVLPTSRFLALCLLQLRFGASPRSQPSAADLGSVELCLL